MNSDSRSPDTSAKPLDLTPSEIESLRQDAKQASERLKELIAADSRLSPSQTDRGIGPRPDLQNSQGNKDRPMEASSHATMPSDDEQQRFRELIADFYQAAVRRAGEDSANAVIEHLIEEKLRKWSLSALPEDLRGQIESDKGEILRHEMNRHHLSEDEKARNRSDLIRLWSGAGASRIYDKKAWTNIEAQLLDADLI